MFCLYLLCFYLCLFVSSWSPHLTPIIHPYQVQAPEHSHNLRGMLLWGKGALDSYGVHGGREPLWVAALRLGHWMGCTTQVWQHTVHTYSFVETSISYTIDENTEKKITRKREEREHLQWTKIDNTGWPSKQLLVWMYCTRACPAWFIETWSHWTTWCQWTATRWNW